MQELDAGQKIALHGLAAAAALERFQRQLERWGLVMPDVPPLVLDFGLNRYAEFGLIEYWVANEITAGYCGKFLFVFDRQTCPKHRHRTKMETFYILKGTVEIEAGGRRRTLNPGAVLPVPPMTWHRFTGIGPALLLEISSPCIIADNEFADPRIPIGRSRPRTP